MNQLVTRPDFALTVPASDAAAAETDNPQRELRIGAIVAALFFVLFLGWAAFMPMDAAAYAPGQLQVSGQRQTVQHRDGGVVAAMHVREGQKVRAGQILIQLKALPEEGARRAGQQPFVSS